MISRLVPGLILCRDLLSRRYYFCSSSNSLSPSPWYRINIATGIPGGVSTRLPDYNSARNVFGYFFSNPRERYPLGNENFNRTPLPSPLPPPRNISPASPLPPMRMFRRTLETDFLLRRRRAVTIILRSNRTATIDRRTTKNVVLNVILLYRVVTSLF